MSKPMILLNQLIQIDCDASLAYQQAIQQEASSKTKQQWKKFQEEHEKHIYEISSELKRLGGLPIQREAFPANKFFTENFVAIVPTYSSTQILKAMFSNEELTNYLYDSVLHEALPETIKSLLRKHRDEEKESP